MAENPKDRQPLLAEKELDARYRENPFPSFIDWDAEEPRDEARQARALSEEIDAEVEDAGEEGQERLRRALDVTLRAAAVDTGAIEGLYDTDEGVTMTIAKRATGWQAVAEAKDILPFFEAQLSALQIVMDLVTEGKPIVSEITEVAIKGLHAEITKNQTTYEVQTPAGRQLHELPRGVYKKQPNHVVTAEGDPFPYAPVLDTPKEMERLVGELGSKAFLEAAPIVQAAYCHYSLVRIHPFADGNGRVARALASIYLLRSYRIPLVVFNEERSEYLEALRAADRSSKVSFNEFVGKSVIGAMELALDEIRLESMPSVEDETRKIRSLLAPDGVDYRVADHALEHLVKLAGVELGRASKAAAESNPDVRFNIQYKHQRLDLTDYRPPVSPVTNNALIHEWSIVSPVHSDLPEPVVREIVALASSDSSQEKPTRIFLTGSVPLEVEAGRVLEPDARLLRRLRRWADRSVAEAVRELRARLESTLEENGAQG